MSSQDKPILGSVLEFPFNSSPGSLSNVLRAISPSRPSFIYERISTRTRAPERTCIGIGRNQFPSATDEADAFGNLRRYLTEHAAGRDSPQAVFAFLSYEALVAEAPPAGGSLATPHYLLISPSLLIDLDHVAGVARLSGDRHGALSDIKAALTQEGGGTPQQSRLAPSADGLSGWRPNQTQEEFVATASLLQKEMAARGDIVGAALSVELELEAACDPLEAYLVLRQINPSTCMFFVEDQEFALWGATSLPVLKIQGRQLTAETDGATRRIEPGAADTWIPSAKENEEYDLVVAALRDDLAGVIEPSSLAFVADREPRQYFNLRHLFAEVTGRLAPGVDAVSALKRLTPHGAATGYGKSAAVELIGRFDARPRGPYAGAVAVLDLDGSADAACVIRSAWKVGSTIRTRAGAKVVSTSDPAAEYQESVLKTLPLRRSIGQVISS